MRFEINHNVHNEHNEHNENFLVQTLASAMEVLFSKAVRCFVSRCDRCARCG